VHARLRENAEPVAFYGGIAKEGVGVLDRFSKLMRHRLRVLRTQLRHSVVQVQSFGSQMHCEQEERDVVLCNKGNVCSSSSASHMDQTLRDA
jgi:ABC transporter transmembrane region 2